MAGLGDLLRDAAAGTALAPGLEANAPFFLSLRGGDACADAFDGHALVGLARVLATQSEVAGFLAHRPGLLERLAALGDDSLDAREAELAAEPIPVSAAELEDSLDALRLLRREETCFAACHDLAGLAPFPRIADFLSVLAESIAAAALALAQEALSDAPPLGVLGMGKVAGREFTYHSDLDLILLHGGGAGDVDASSRVGQRFITYLTTMTGAGTAYSVDTRLRPSGNQGVLVTSLAAYERYQREQAHTWEHLALLRARAIAGARADAQATLDRVRDHVVARASPPWDEIAPMRRRVEEERTAKSESERRLKTGPGGLMDVDFLAGGAVLERRARSLPELPSIAALLHAAARGERIEAVVRDYHALRVIEARARWCAGRAVETLRTDDPVALDVVAELVEPGLVGGALVERLAELRGRLRAAYDAVMEAGTIAALER